jgi:hypothetical protein
MTPMFLVVAGSSFAKVIKINSLIMTWLILWGIGMPTGFMPPIWFLPRLMIARKKTPWRTVSSRRSSYFFGGYVLWSSKAWLALGSSPAFYVVEFSLWRNESTMALSTLGQRTLLVWSLPLSCLIRRCSSASEDLEGSEHRPTHGPWVPCQ